MRPAKYRIPTSDKQTNQNNNINDPGRFGCRRERAVDNNRDAKGPCTVDDNIITVIQQGFQIQTASSRAISPTRDVIHIIIVILIIIIIRKIEGKY